MKRHAGRSDTAITSWVKMHLISNFVLPSKETPLILGVFGPTGEGKTYQINSTCANLNIQIISISPGELENPNAGHPASMIRGQYLKASSNIRLGQPSILLINDIDTVLGNWGELVQYTINRQTLYGQLMSLCDNPLEVSGQSCERVPIVVTGNNSQSLYPPLIRPQRMRLKVWNPEYSDRVPLVAQVFPELPQYEIIQIVRQYPSHSISFWADVRALLNESKVQSQVDLLSEQDLAQIIAGGTQRAQVAPNNFSKNDILHQAHELSKTIRSSRDFIDERK